MSQLTRGQEAEEASFAFQAALASLGLTTIEDAQTMWDDLPAQAKVATAQRWINTATEYIMSRRVEARALGMAYYRLTRALRTGTTIFDPYEPNLGDTVTMGELRAEFDRLIGAASRGEVEAPEKSEPVETDLPDEDNDYPDQDEIADDDEVIRQEELKLLREELDQLEKEAKAEAEELLKVLGIDNEANKIKGEEKKRKPKTPQEIHDEVGPRQAATAGRIVMNGARGVVVKAGNSDDKLLGWIRVSSTGTPCGWCAMLISRGPVIKNGKLRLNLYKSARSAGGSQNEDGTRAGGTEAEYHDNDYCYAMPIYSLKEYNTSPRFALNRKYAAEWPQVTKGLGGDAAISKWRKHIRAQNKASKAQAA